MADIVRFDTISQYNAFNRHETRHPLVNVIDLAKADVRRQQRLYFGFYTVFLKQAVCGDLRYGLSTYDYQEGTLIFLAPGQLLGEAGDQYYQPQGLALVFHPDLLLGTALGRHMGDYTFFDYEAREALHVSEREKQIVLDCLAKIDFELTHAVDKHSKRLIVTTIELFLNYCVRFYDRQFITRDHAHRGLLAQFEQLLTEYFASDKPAELGLPTVGYCAEQLHLSANYFGDMVKKETGQSAKEYIQLKLLALAKERMFDLSKSVSEVAFGLGFKYPQHFSRVFKQLVGCTPSEYRALN